MIDYRWHNVQAPGAFNQRIHDIVTHIVAAHYKDAKDLYHKSSDKVKNLFEVIGDHIVPIVMPSSKWFNKSLKTKGEGQWIIPPIPHKTFIEGHERKSEDQYFRPVRVEQGWYPDNLDKTGVAKFQSGNKGAYDREWYQSENGDVHITKRMRDFAKRETYRRMNGHWFYNNGRKTYITGPYYVFLNYTFTEKGKNFEYRERDRKWFLFWDYCKWHPKCLGMIVPKPRRVGDTSKTLSIMMEEVTRGIGKNVGMQSKDEKSADKAWNTMFKRIWESWPAFWKPTNQGFTSKAIKFGKSHNRHVSSRKSYTGSYVDYGSTDPHHYDSQKLNFFYSDEGGKWNPKKGANVTILQLWDKVKETMAQGNKKTGMAMFASTVEEMTAAGGDKFQRLYYESSITNIKGTRTISGLFQFFSKAEESFEGFIDRYGMPVIHPPDPKTLKYLRTEAAKIVENDPDVTLDLDELELGAREALAVRLRTESRGGTDKENQQRRKFPQSIEDAFIADTKGNPLPAASAAARISAINSIRNEYGRELYRRGILEWDGPPFQVGSKLFFRETKYGWLYVSRDRGFLHVDNDEANRVRPTDMGLEKDRYMPYGDKYHSGWDPYDGYMKDPERSVLSDGAFLVIEKPNPNAVGIDGELDINKPSAGPGLEQYNWVSGNFVAMICERTSVPAEHFMHCAMVMWWYGATCSLERNRDAAFGFIVERGMRQFITARQFTEAQGGSQRLEKEIGQKGLAFVERGDFTGASTKAGWIEYWSNWLPNHAHKCVFEKVLKDIINFSPGDETKLDLYVAGGECLTWLYKEGSVLPEELPPLNL